MSFEDTSLVRPVCVIVVANEKGGSGKSTVAMHLAVALLKRGRRVATIDLDSRQRSLTRYIEHRRAWARHAGRDLEIPGHVCIDEAADQPTVEGDVTPSQILADMVDVFSRTYDTIVIDTPGHDSGPMRLAHAMADILVTPLNDSFVDLDVLGSFDAETVGMTGLSHYAQTVEEARNLRRSAGKAATDWIVMRNRLSMLSTRNKRVVGAALQGLSDRLGFRLVQGLAERVIFREFYLRGLTALDDLDQGTLGTRPTLSHVTARQEVETLINAVDPDRSTVQGPLPERNRDAA